MNSTSVTVVGNLVADPVQRQVAADVRVTGFRIACTPRVPDGAGGWSDGRTGFYQVSAWRQLGANTGESLRKGERVVVVGRLGVDTWEDRDGNSRSTVEITADHVGHDLTFGTSRFTRVLRAASGGPGGADPADDDGEPGGGEAETGTATAAVTAAAATASG